MGKVLPNAWQYVLSYTQADLAAGGDRATALRTLDYGLTRKPGDPWLTIGQGQIHMQIGDFPRAAGLLDGALAAASEPAVRRSALFNRGLANLNLGNSAQAARESQARRTVGEIGDQAANARDLNTATVPPDGPRGRQLDIKV